MVSDEGDEEPLWEQADEQALAQAARELAAFLATLRQDQLTEPEQAALRTLLADLLRLRRASAAASPNGSNGP